MLDGADDVGSLGDSFTHRVLQSRKASKKMYCSFPVIAALALAVGFFLGGIATVIGFLFFAVAIEDPDEPKRKRPPVAMVSTPSATINSQLPSASSIKDVTYH